MAIALVRDGKHVVLSMEEMFKLLDENPTLLKGQRKKVKKPTVA